MRIVPVIIGLFLSACSLAAAPDPIKPARPYVELEVKRIDEIAQFLPEKPAGFGRPISDRGFWENTATRASVGNVVRSAEAFLGKDLPPWNDELYLEFSRIGRRPPGEKMQAARSAWLRPLMLAECIENKGRFLPALAKAIEGYLAEPTWTMPAHDGNLANFKRKSYSVDLRSSAFGAELAQALYLLEDRLDAGLRTRLMAALEERCLGPVRQTLITGKGGNWWLGSKQHPEQNNWNTVCLAGVVNAARTVSPSRQDRALFIAAGEHYSAYFLNGFRKDGFCDEGGGYWSYGFGNFIVLREVIIQSTQGKVDLFADPKVRNIALFGSRFQLGDGLMPPFADCRAETRADKGLLAYCNQVLKLGLDGLDNVAPLGRQQFMEPTPYAGPQAAKTADERIGVRSYFEDSKILVCRPSSAASRLAAAIKAGGNSSHSHNDIGSFAITQGKTMMVGEAGGPCAYNNKVFSSQRYTFKILNSFGHPVPVPAGQLQKDATTVKAPVLSTSFTEAADEIQIDLKPAYTVPELAKLTRTLRYDRGGSGAVTIEDEVVFNKPSTFETALTTRATWKQVNDRTILFTSAGETLQATIDTATGFTISAETIEELEAPVYTRLGIKLAQPVTGAKIKITFTPATPEPPRK
jgi:hypothetical protein